MDTTEHNRRELRKGIERLVRLTPLTGVYVTNGWPYHDGFYGVNVNAGYDQVEPPPLDATRQLALSVLLGEPVPTQVLLSAMEDAGMFPGGVFEAVREAENEPLDMGSPVYPDDENWMEGNLRFSEVAGGWHSGQKAQVYGVCKGLWGSGNAGIGNMFGNFLDQWLGRNTQRLGGATFWPTTDYLRDRMAKFPPLARVFRHLRLTAKPATAERLTALIEHLDRR